MKVYGNSRVGTVAGKVLGATLLLTTWTNVAADTVLEFSSRSGDQTSITRSLIVKDGRVGFITPSGGKVDTIFDQNQSAFAFINHQDRQFTIISSDWMREMHQAAQESRKKMQEKMDQQLQNMPPQQRAMYEQGRMMMPMMMPYMTNLTRPNHLRTAVPLYIRQTVNGIECQRVDLLEGGRKTQELCVAQRGALKDLSANDYETLLAMLKVAQELDTLGAFSLGFQRPFIAAWGGGRPGLPIAVTEHTSAVSTVTTLQSLRNEPINTEKLQLPSGYLQAKIPLPIR